MDRAFFVIYIQPLSRLTAAALLVLLLWHRGREPLWRLVNRPRLWSWAAFGLLLLWALAVLYVTLLDRSEGERGVMLSPFWSYRAMLAGENWELLRSNLMNVLLFLPGGLLLGEVAPRDWRGRTVLLALGASFVFSVGIEMTQGVCSLGLAETDDVIHNTLGGLIGSLPAALSKRMRSNTPER